nr:MAG TPA_asm: hypothetical protein [Caudoviricetes sp.]
MAFFHPLPSAPITSQTPCFQPLLFPCALNKLFPASLVLG